MTGQKIGSITWVITCIRNNSLSYIMAQGAFGCAMLSAMEQPSLKDIVHCMNEQFPVEVRCMVGDYLSTDHIVKRIIEDQVVPDYRCGLRVNHAVMKDYTYTIHEKELHSHKLPFFKSCQGMSYHSDQKSDSTCKIFASSGWYFVYEHLMDDELGGHKATVSCFDNNKHLVVTKDFAYLVHDVISIEESGNNFVIILFEDRTKYNPYASDYGRNELHYVGFEVCDIAHDMTSIYSASLHLFPECVGIFVDYDDKELRIHNRYRDLEWTNISQIIRMHNAFKTRMTIEQKIFLRMLLYSVNTTQEDWMGTSHPQLPLNEKEHKQELETFKSFEPVLQKILKPYVRTVRWYDEVIDRIFK